MAKTDAWGATGGSFHARRTAASRARAGLMGNARLIAEPAYQRLLAAEPVLRRAIPVLIVVFLAVIAGARGLSLMNDRDDIERQAKGMLALAAGQLSHAVALAPAPDESQEGGAQEGGAEAWNAVLSEKPVRVARKPVPAFSSVDHHHRSTCAQELECGRHACIAASHNNHIV